MINYFSKKNKHGLHICEDLKTSLIFELLIQLDIKTFNTILSKACDESFDDFGRIISINFWPKWNPEGTNHKKYIEPDVFIRCENTDIIIEAKKDLTNTQIEKQWTDQITAYNNEYSLDNKRYMLIAVDGNLSLHSDPKESIYKTSWERIYNAVSGIKEQLPDYKYNLLSLAFQLIGISQYNSIYDFLEKHPKTTKINFSLLDIIKKIYGNI